MPTVYEQNPASWDKIAANGCPNVALMARHFSTCGEMDKALGYTKAASNWARRGGQVSPQADRAAGLWLSLNAKPAPAAPPPAAPASGTLLLIVCPPDVAPKVERVATMLGCEVIAD